MRKDITDLKKLIIEGIKNEGISVKNEENVQILNRIYSDVKEEKKESLSIQVNENPELKETALILNPREESYNLHVEVEESLSIEEKEKELISKALTKYKGRRKQAAGELGISERTLYRKIKEYDLK